MVGHAMSVGRMINVATCGL